MDMTDAPCGRTTKPHVAHYWRGFASDDVPPLFCPGIDVCKNCGSIERPQIFRGTLYCSIACQKALGLDDEGNRKAEELHPHPEMQTELEKKLLRVISALIRPGRGEEIAMAREGNLIVYYVSAQAIERAYPCRVEFRVDPWQVAIIPEDS